MPASATHPLAGRKYRTGRGQPATGRAPALRSSRLRTRTRSSRISRAFPPGGYAPPVVSTVPARWREAEV